MYTNNVLLPDHQVTVYLNGFDRGSSRYRSAVDSPFAHDDPRGSVPEDGLLAVPRPAGSETAVRRRLGEVESGSTVDSSDAGREERGSQSERAPSWTAVVLDGARRSDRGVPLGLDRLGEPDGHPRATPRAPATFQFGVARTGVVGWLGAA
jgi:hypothetical protein